MTYYGKEKENHAGSHVRYCSGGQWYEGTLIEPVNYQIVATKENLPAILSTHTYVKPDERDVRRAEENVGSGKYTNHDLILLMRNLSPNGVYRVSEVDSVEITDAYDVTEEEAGKLAKELAEKYSNNPE